VSEKAKFNIYKFEGDFHNNNKLLDDIVILYIIIIFVRTLM